MVSGIGSLSLSFFFPHQPARRDPSDYIIKNIIPLSMIHFLKTFKSAVMKIISKGSNYLLLA
jgi:hypothetical protein